MKRDLRTIFISLLLVSLFSMLALGQETGGSMEITVKDAAGAVVPNVAITVESSGSTAGFRRTVTTDDSGTVRILALPPGTYTLTAAAVAGFVETKINGVGVGLGRTTPVALEMRTSVGAEVTITSGDVLPIDVTDTKIQTTINSDTAELLPKGNNFSSVLKISPATRPEPRSGQFQIDGASGSENTFIIDGLEVTNVRTGTLDANSNLPFSIVQEVQIKSSGFEAEFGGATGGVINVVTRGGGNQFRGEFGSNFRLSSWEPVAGPTLRNNGGFPQYYPSKRDHYSEFNPTLNLGGPIWKNRIWFFSSYAPQIFERERTIVHQGTRTENYKFRQVREFAFGRIDAQPFSKLHLTGSYNWDPVTQLGGTPAWTAELSAPAIQPGTCTVTTNPCVPPGLPPRFDGAAYVNQTGGRQNSLNYSLQGVYTVTNNLLVSGRMGYYFLNEKLGSYGNRDTSNPRIVCSTSSPIEFPAGFGCRKTAPGPFNNGIAQITNTQFDATSRRIYEGDATYSFSAGGRHELKGGYQYNGIANQVELGTNDVITLRHGTPIAQLATLPGLASSPNAIGSGVAQTFRTRGDVSSNNQGIYIQDKWQPKNWMTLNLGVRTEQELVPSFAPGLPGIKFSFKSKLAPRLGAAFDVTGDGRTKVSAFYGWFFDRFKYELPRGSFGGDEFHNLYFEMFSGDTLATYTPALLYAGGSPIPGGATAPGLTTLFGRIRYDKDNRISSNSGRPIEEVGGVDPNIKPFKQTELTFTVERMLWKNYRFSGRYTHKAVTRTIEDAGFPTTDASEYYIIGNPGEGLHLSESTRFGLMAPRPERKYDALEIRFDRGFAKHFYFNANYTYSRLFGNYSGLSSSDEEGRLSPNVNRYFDQPPAGYTVAGGPDNGLLPTDRPHVIKFNGAYSFDWNRIGLSKNNSTDLLLFTTASSGTLLTTFVTINGIDFIPLTKRGDLGRTPKFTQTDFAIRHRVKFGRDGRFTFVAEADAINLFNENAVTNRYNFIHDVLEYTVNDTRWGLITGPACVGNVRPCLLAGYSVFQKTGAPLILADALLPANRSNLYNIPTAYQADRTFRFGFRLLF